MSFSQVADLLNTTPTAQKMDFIKDVSLSIFDHFENDVSRHISEHLILSKRLYVNPFQPSDAFHIETSHLFCRAKQTTGFYMKHYIRLK